jgi:hypothetical protein
MESAVTVFFQAYPFWQVWNKNPYVAARSAVAFCNGKVTIKWDPIRLIA